MASRFWGSREERVRFHPARASEVDAPERWRREDTVRYRLAWNDRQLGFVGCVAWREAEDVGIELQNPTPALQAELESALEQMLSCAA